MTALTQQLPQLSREDEERAAAVAIILLGSRDAAAAVCAARTTLRQRARRDALRELDTLPEPYRKRIREALKPTKRPRKSPPSMGLTAVNDNERQNAV